MTFGISPCAFIACLILAVPEPPEAPPEAAAGAPPSAATVATTPQAVHAASSDSDDEPLYQKRAGMCGGMILLPRWFKKGGPTTLREVPESDVPQSYIDREAEATAGIDV